MMTKEEFEDRNDQDMNDYYNSIYDILEEKVGANPIYRKDFLRSIADEAREYRIGGLLGYGGKYWTDTNSVNCYSEDLNPLRVKIIEETNELLKKFAREW